jgi:ferredoxin-like protein FixX
LRGDKDTTTPLALYLNHAGQTALVTAKAIERNMRACAAAVYNIKKEEELQLWSAHSLRVGACNSLHAMGFSPSEIKWTLRWRSDSFMDYLRNTHVLATKQNRVLDEGSAMPNFL